MRTTLKWSLDVGAGLEGGCERCPIWIAMPTSFPQRTGKPVTWRHARNNVLP